MLRPSTPRFSYNAPPLIQSYHLFNKICWYAKGATMILTFAHYVIQKNHKHKTCNHHQQVLHCTNQRFAGVKVHYKDCGTLNIQKSQNKTQRLFDMQTWRKK